MIKYKCEHPAAQRHLDILSWDRYMPGYLNRQIIVLLKSLDISDSAFLNFQKRYIKQILELNLQKIDGNLMETFNYADDGEDSFVLTISCLKGCFDLSTDIFFQELL